MAMPSNDPTVQEFLEKECDRYASQMESHVQILIESFQNQAKKTRQEMVKSLEQK